MSDDVFVIGAGLEGLSAARKLHDAGAVTRILETGDRIGGRVRSAAVGAAQVETGASWIHGLEGNPLAGFAREDGVALRPNNGRPWEVCIRGRKAAAGEPARRQSSSAPPSSGSFPSFVYCWDPGRDLTREWNCSWTVGA